MSQRPKIWIHRTRRFWFGLALIVLLLGFSITMGFHVGGVGWFTHANYPNSLASFRGTTYVEGTTRVVGFQNGGVFYSRSHHVRPALLPTNPKFIWIEKLGYDLLPGVRKQDLMGRHDENRRQVFVPLWPLIGILAILWLFWMHRAEKKELENVNAHSPPT